MLVEHARSYSGMADASHAEYGPNGTAVITLLACSLQGKTISVRLTPDSRLAALHGAGQVEELTSCSYGLASAYQGIAREHGMRVAGVDHTGEVRAIERTDHPFFVGTLYQPQLQSRPGDPHPVFIGLLTAANLPET